MLTSIDFLPACVTPGGQVVIAAAANANILERPTPSAVSGNGYEGKIYLKRIDAVCTVAGAAGNFSLRDQITVDLLLAVGASVAGDRIVWEFPIPRKFDVSCNMSLPAGIGTWAFIANGYLL